VDDPDQEAPWRVRAAQSAASTHAAHLAADHWLRLLEIWPRVRDVERIGARLVSAHLEAIVALEASGRVDQAIELSRQALTGFENEPSAERGRLLSKAGAMIGIGDPDAGFRMLDEAQLLLEPAGPSSALVTTLERSGGLLRGMGRLTEAGTKVAQAVELARETGDPRVLRRLLAVHAWQQAEAGAIDTARMVADEVTQMTIADDPMGDLWAGVALTDLLLQTGGTADQIVTAAAAGARVLADWPFRNFRSSLLLGNISRGLTRAGRVQEAAELITPHTNATVATDTWPAYEERAWIEMARGNLDEAWQRLEDLEPLDIRNVLFLADIAEVRAECDLWRGRPREAWERLIAALDLATAGEAATRTAPLFALAARAAADHLADAAVGDRARLARKARLELDRRLSSAAVDPFGDHPVPADIPAWRATYAAELTRLAGQADPAAWGAAARVWQRLERPHPAAYSQWRGALAAAGAGASRTAVRRHLTDAARAARGHASLEAAIRAALG